MPFAVNRLDQKSLPLLLDLQEKIYESMPEKANFQRSSEEFILGCLTDSGLAYSVTMNGMPVAYRMVYFPRQSEKNLGRDIGLSPEQLDHCAHWDTVGVLPDWRGHQLSYLMNQAALKDLETTGTRHLLATTSPGNPYGLASLIKIGFRAYALKEKFGGALRLVCYRPFPGHFPQEPGPAPIRLSLKDRRDIAVRFDEGWVGVECERSGDWFNLVMIKKRA